MRWLLAAAFGLLLVAAPATAAKRKKRRSKAPPPPAVKTILSPLSSDPMGVSVHRLANGLTVYLSPNHEEPRVFAAIAVRAGAKQDPDESTGMAHYLEHMLFKGSQRMGTLDYEKEKPHLDKISDLYEQMFKAQGSDRARLYRDIDKENIQASAFAIPNEIDKLYDILGFTEVNAHTTDESTVFVSNFPANRTEAWAMIESDRFSQPIFRMFQSELEAVYEEKNRSMDNPDVALWDAVERQLYKKHPYGQRTVLGSIEHLKRPSLTRMAAYYDAYYRPSNMAIVLSGDFDRGAMLQLLQRYFGGWTPRPPAPDRSWEMPPPQGTERAEVRFEAEERVVIAWPTVANGHPDVDALTVMDMLVDNEQAGIVNLRLNQAQKVKAAGSFPVFYNDAGSWRLWASPKKGQSLRQAENLLLQAVEWLRKGEFSEDDLRAVVTEFEVAEKRRLETNEARASAILESFIEGEPWPKAAARLDRLRRVTKADVLRAANAYLGPNRVIVYRRSGRAKYPFIEKPRFTKVDIDPARQSAFARQILALPARPLEPRFLREGHDYWTMDQLWGRLYATRNPMNDLFSASFVFNRGRNQERAICEAMELLELSGGGELTADAYKRALYSLGTTESLSCSQDQVVVNLSGLEANFDKSLALMRSRFEEPGVSPDVLKKMIDIEIGAHRDNKKDPAAIAQALVEYAKRGEDSYVLNQLSDLELRRLKLADLQAITKGLFGYKRNVLYAGVRSIGALTRSLQIGGTGTSDNPGYTPPEDRPPKVYRRLPRPTVFFVDRDMVQARVGVLAPDQIYKPEEEIDAHFYNAYMDGSMSGVLFQEIREARSLAYASGGGYSLGERKGDENALWGDLGCQADKTVEASELLANLLRHPPFSEARFRQAKKAVEEHYRAQPIPFRSIPGALLSWEEHGIYGDPRPERFQRALGYRITNLTNFSQRFRDLPLVVYVLGNRHWVDLAGMKKLGEVRELGLDDIFPY